MSRERVIPAGWLAPSTGVKRVVMHWTAGNYQPSAFDRLHYHILIDGSGEAIRGPRRPGLYLPHTRNLNTGSVGLSICAMAGAIEGRVPYKVPVTMLQWERACQAAAEILHAYALPVSERTILCHSEVGRVYGIPQRGKWDVDTVAQRIISGDELHAEMRRKVAWYWERV